MTNENNSQTPSLTDLLSRLEKAAVRDSNEAIAQAAKATSDATRGWWLGQSAANAHFAAVLRDQIAQQEGAAS